MPTYSIGISFNWERYNSLPQCPKCKTRWTFPTKKGFKKHIRQCNSGVISI